jgi:hypothetical protein
MYTDRLTHQACMLVFVVALIEASWAGTDICLDGDPSRGVLPFDVAAKQFDWQSLRDYQQRHKRLQPQQLTLLTDFLTPYLHTTLKPVAEPAIPPHVAVDCASAEYASILTGKRRATPAKILDFIPFAYEIDTLEIRLYELNDTVEMHCVMEGLYTHRGFRKPLFLEHYNARLAPFRDKIIRVVADDADQRSLIELGDRDVWLIEHQMRTLPLKKYEAGFGRIEPDTLILHGDCDEIPSRRALLHIKQCELRQTPLLFTVDFYIFSFNWQFMSKTLRYPALFRRGDVVRESDATERLLRGSVLQHTPQMAQHNGAHLNRFIYTLVDKIFKEAAMAEGGVVDFTPFSDGITTQTEWLKTGYWNSYIATRASGTYIPWFAAQNRDRFLWLFVAPETIDVAIVRTPSNMLPPLIKMWVHPQLSETGWPEAYNRTYQSRDPLRNCDSRCVFVAAIDEANVLFSDAEPCIRHRTNILVSFMPAWEARAMERYTSACRPTYFVSYKLETTTSSIVSATFFSVDDLLNSARENAKLPKRRAVGFVSRRDEPHRTRYARDLGKIVPLASYGTILNNAAWPPNHVGDKIYALAHNLFCLAIENTPDEPEYITEKLWDCMRAGSIPLYRGTLGRAVLPADSIIRIDDFVSAEALGQHLNNLGHVDIAKHQR